MALRTKVCRARGNARVGPCVPGQPDFPGGLAV